MSLSKKLFTAALVAAAALVAHYSPNVFKQNSDYKSENIERVFTPDEASKESVTPANELKADDAIVTADAAAPLVELQRLKNCLTSDDCEFSQEDPRAYGILVGKQIRNEILSELSKRRDNPKALEELSKEARDLINTHDEFIQEAALEVFAAQEPSAENMEAIVNGLNGTADPSLMEQAMDIFKDYMGTAYEPQVHSFLATSIQQGAHFAGERAAENIMPFVNDNSAADYQKALSQMSPGTSAYQRLKSALDEFQRLKSGA